MALMFLSLQLGEEHLSDAWTLKVSRRTVPPHALGFVQHSHSPGPPPCDLRASVVGLEISEVEQLIVFHGKDLEGLCSYFQLHRPGCMVGKWGVPAAGVRTPVFQAASTALSNLSSERHHLSDLLCSLRLPRSNRARTWLWRTARSLVLTSFL